MFALLMQQKAVEQKTVVCNTVAEIDKVDPNTLVVLKILDKDGLRNWIDEKGYYYL